MRAQLGHQVRLGLEHLPHLAGDDLGEHDLDGDLPSRQVLLVEEDVGESAGAEHADVREAGKVRWLGWQTPGHVASRMTRALR